LAPAQIREVGAKGVSGSAFQAAAAEYGEILPIVGRVVLHLAREEAVRDDVKSIGLLGALAMLERPQLVSLKRAAGAYYHARRGSAAEAVFRELIKVKVKAETVKVTK
jgi:hypothetical protein